MLRGQAPCIGKLEPAPGYSRTAEGGEGEVDSACPSRAEEDSGQLVQGPTLWPLLSLLFTWVSLLEFCANSNKLKATQNQSSKAGSRLAKECET